MLYVVLLTHVLEAVILKISYGMWFVVTWSFMHASAGACVGTGLLRVVAASRDILYIQSTGRRCSLRCPTACTSGGIRHRPYYALNIRW